MGQENHAARTSHGKKNLRPKKATKESKNPTAKNTKSKKLTIRKLHKRSQYFSHTKIIPRQETWKLKSLE
jgi:hypothetical protein